MEEIRLCPNGRLPRVPRKPRYVRRNSHELKDKNEQYIRYLYRGGESRIRTMNLAGRIHLKNRMNSASCAPETLLRADVLRRRSRPLARLVRARTSKTDLGSGLFRHPGHALCCLSPAFSARWSCRFCRRLASIHGLGAFELLGSGRAIRTGGLRHLRALAFGSMDIDAV